MTHCDLQTELLEDGTYRHSCQRAGCGNVYVTAAPRCRLLCQIQAAHAVSHNEPSNARRNQCKTIQRSPPQTPSLFRRGVSFLSAHRRWLAAGRPVRSPERVREIFAICKECEYFRPGTADIEGSCRLCGCRLRDSGGMINKIQMATEGCPANPPRWDPEIVKEHTAVKES